MFVWSAVEQGVNNCTCRPIAIQIISITYLLELSLFVKFLISVDRLLSENEIFHREWQQTMPTVLGVLRLHCFRRLRQRSK